ncbi:PadR family transcriptional regulator [Lactiplantibacillus mudanjiangensis]|uniref:PadR family transcriptional regulator (Plasmid) [Lactobacillus plantarum] n=1 Tax=Lactiplantibacillus mudanjiangensis TaxID=1296538 RepID=A0A660E1T3_9LACO|nr:PadR family transcriptional regulator [Lactiplantibacillus mudanjiangensis]VDG24716.1 PadR family transcriptional regulator (plasmid) [Lactobacillus plantarum] [Lactiplantibacillus mudanjiangensis]VDG28017.1 PadR family transcriptional regulator (plasmid) [Lactobacillus plantarum] [Lactiplantibacillus mudanjiangensis]
MMNELFVLGELMEEPQNGYQLRTAMQVSLGHHRRISFGVIYPLFERLQKQGLITLQVIEAPKKTKIATITDAGKDRFLELMATPIPAGAHNNDIFLIKLDVMQHLPLERQLTLLDAYATEQSAIITEAQLAAQHLQQHDRPDHWYAAQKLTLRIAQAQVAQKWVADFKQQLQQRG